MKYELTFYNSIGQRNAKLSSRFTKLAGLWPARHFAILNLNVYAEELGIGGRCVISTQAGEMKANYILANGLIKHGKGTCNSMKLYADQNTTFGCQISAISSH